MLVILSVLRAGVGGAADRPVGAGGYSGLLVPNCRWMLVFSVAEGLS